MCRVAGWAGLDIWLFLEDHYSWSWTWKCVARTWLSENRRVPPSPDCRAEPVQAGKRGGALLLWKLVPLSRVWAHV